MILHFLKNEKKQMKKSNFKVLFDLTTSYPSYHKVNNWYLASPLLNYKDS